MLGVKKPVGTSSNIVDMCLYILLPSLMQVKMQLKFWIQLLFLGSYKGTGVGQGLCKPFLQVFKKAEANPMIEKEILQWGTVSNKWIY